MSARSDIEWTTHTWPLTRGCSRKPVECDNCYAMNMAHRFSWGHHLTRRHTVRLPVLGSEGRRVVEDMVDWSGAVDLNVDALDQPLRWREGAKIFVCSGSDLFHPKVPFEFIAAGFGVMAVAQRHTFQVLTKHTQRMAEFFAWLEAGGPLSGHDRRSTPSEVIHSAAFTRFSQRGARRFADMVWNHQPSPWPLPNVWCGTSVGIRSAKSRIDALRQVPASVRFLSIEPLLEDLGELDLSDIGWVIVGGESGARARPMHPDWARSIRDQCEAAHVPFFYKQNGAFGPSELFSHCRGRRHVFADGQEVVRVGKKKAGRELDGVQHNDMPPASL
jgi:protein gp37